MMAVMMMMMSISDSDTMRLIEIMAVMNWMRKVMMSDIVVVDCI
jgi:hypothetical protein